MVFSWEDNEIVIHMKNCWCNLLHFPCWALLTSLSILYMRYFRISDQLELKSYSVVLFVHYATFQDRLIEDCWHPDCAARPSFSEIISRMNVIIANCSNHGWWKDTFKLPWYAYAFLVFSFLSYTFSMTLHCSMNHQLLSSFMQT